LDVSVNVLEAICIPQEAGHGLCISTRGHACMVSVLHQGVAMCDEKIHDHNST